MYENVKFFLEYRENFQEKLVSYSNTKNLHFKCKIGVSLLIIATGISCISGGQLYKNLQLRFKRAVTIVDTTIIRI